MYKFCKTAKGKDQTMCYYMGVGDSEQGTSGGVKREISSSFSRGVNAKRLCNRLKKKDGQMCELKYEKKIDPSTADWKKLRVKELPSPSAGIACTMFENMSTVSVIAVF